MKYLFKRIIVFTLLFLSTVFSIHSESHKLYNIEGKVFSNKKGVLYIFLVDKQNFSKKLGGFKKIKITKTEIGYIKFKFENIPEGEYGIRCFLDINNDGILNLGPFIHEEPWGFSWKNKHENRKPKFNEISFYINEDIKNLKIILSE